MRKQATRNGTDKGGQIPRMTTDIAGRDALPPKPSQKGEIGRPEIIGIIGFPRRTSQMSSFNGMANSLGRTCPIDIQDVSTERPKPWRPFYPVKVLASNRRGRTPPERTEHIASSLRRGRPHLSIIGTIRRNKRDEASIIIVGQRPRDGRHTAGFEHALELGRIHGLPAGLHFYLIDGTRRQRLTIFELPRPGPGPHQERRKK